MSDRPLLDGCAPSSFPGGPHGVLVVHGFTGCPQSMRPLADAFASAGFAVELPLLPGHGTTVDDMITTGWSDWSQAVEGAYLDLAGRCDRVVVAGLSMGATLTAWLAVRHPDIAGIVCVNPATVIDPAITASVRDLIEAGEDRIPGLGGDIADPEAHEVAYDATPLAPLLSFAAATDELRPRLGGIACPVLLMTSPEDHTVPATDSDVLAAAVAGPVERVSLDRSYHVATLDHDRAVVAAESVAFARRTTGAA